MPGQARPVVRMLVEEKTAGEQNRKGGGWEGTREDRDVFICVQLKSAFRARSIAKVSGCIVL